MIKLDEMWAALEAHKPERSYAKAWRVMLKERTSDATSAAYDAAPAGSAAKEAALSALVAAMYAEEAWAAERYAQEAIDALKQEVKP